MHMAGIAQQIIAQYYGKPAAHSYFRADGEAWDDPLAALPDSF
jgi:hypothetical protein